MSFCKDMSIFRLQFLMSAMKTVSPLIDMLTGTEFSKVLKDWEF